MWSLNFCRPIQFHWTERCHVPFFPNSGDSALSLCWLGILKKGSTSAIKIPRNSLLAQSRYEGEARRIRSFTSSVQISKKYSSCSRLRWPEANENCANIAVASLAPCANIPPGTAEQKWQQIARRQSTHRAHNDGTTGSQKASDKSGTRSTGDSAAEDLRTQPETLENSFNPCRPPATPALAQENSRESSEQTTNAEQDKKKRILATARRGIEKEGKAVPNTSIFRAPRKTDALAASAHKKRSSKSVDAHEVLLSAPVQKEPAHTDKKKVPRKPAGEADNKDPDIRPRVPVSPESLFRFRYSRSSKPGGSSANRSETKVALHVPLKALEAYYGVPMEKLAQDSRGKINKKGELIISSEKHASQALNKKECMQKLDDMLTSLHEQYAVEEEKKPHTIDEETRRKYKLNILVHKKKEQYQRNCNKVSVRDL